MLLALDLADLDERRRVAVQLDQLTIQALLHLKAAKLAGNDDVLKSGVSKKRTKSPGRTRHMSRIWSTWGRSWNMMRAAAFEMDTRRMLPAVYTMRTSCMGCEFLFRVATGPRGTHRDR